MPVKPFVIQQRYRELGRIRIGEKGEKGQPVKRNTFRLTSPAPDLLERAAELWGGKVQEWKGAPTQGKQWELATKASELPVLVPPQDVTRSQYMELWTGGGVKRRCDGQTELISGRACMCNPDAPECQITTHLLLVLPQLPDLGVWRIVTHGFNAAAELPSTVGLLRQVYEEGQMPGAKLAIEQRTSKVEGKTMHYVVPVLRVPYSLQELAGGEDHQGVPILGRVGTGPRPALPEGRPGLPADREWQGDGAEHGAPPPLPGEGTGARQFEKLTEGQRKALQAGCKDMTREQRLRWASGVTGRNLASFNDLSRDEAKQLLDLLAADPSAAGEGSGEARASAEATGSGVGVDTSSVSEASAGDPERPSEDPIVNDEPHKGKHLSVVAKEDPAYVRDLIKRTRVKKRKELAQAWLYVYYPTLA